jgi:hypothetical protein
LNTGESYTDVSQQTTTSGTMAMNAENTQVQGR